MTEKKRENKIACSIDILKEKEGEIKKEMRTLFIGGTLHKIVNYHARITCLYHMFISHRSKSLSLLVGVLST